METNTLKIIPPEGYVVDVEKSTFKEIVFKPNRLNYDDVAMKLFHNKRLYAISKRGDIEMFNSHTCLDCLDANNATSEHQLKCILAKNKLANVARYLNGEWTLVPDSTACYLALSSGKEIDTCHTTCKKSYVTSRILFKTDEFAKQAIEILGEKTIKLALEPLY